MFDFIIDNTRNTLINKLEFNLDRGLTLAKF